MKRGWREIENTDYSKPNITPRCMWTAQEDKLLVELAVKYKGRKWRIVAEAISELDTIHSKPKTAKQCRERWHSHLNPDIVESPWTIEEQTTLLNSHKTVGNKWSVIAENLPGRTDNAIKNFFFCRLRKLARNVKNNILDCGLNPPKELAIQDAYLLDHLYKFYICPEHTDNILKTVYPRIMGRKNQGDKYIVDIFSKDCVSTDFFDKYLKLFLASLSPDTVQLVINEYPQFSQFSPSETDDSYSKSTPPSISKNLNSPILPKLNCIFNI